MSQFEEDKAAGKGCLKQYDGGRVAQGSLLLILGLTLRCQAGTRRANSSLTGNSISIEE